MPTDPSSVSRAAMPPQPDAEEPPRPRVILRAAAVAGAATLGALIGFGVRTGAPARVLGEAGLALRGLPEVVTPDRGFDATSLVGAVHHVVLVAAWSALFVSLASRLRGLRLVGAAAAFAALVWALDVRWLPAPLRLAAGALSPSERVLAYVVLCVALAVGTRLALHGGAASTPQQASKRSGAATL